MLIRRLRGLRVQLLLWTILPLAVVLIVLALASITRHRQAMTQLATDRDRGLALAEANRLAHEIAARTAQLTRAASAERLAPDDLARLAANLQDSYPAGLALLDATGAPLAASEAVSWLADPQTRLLAARFSGAVQPQYDVISGTGRAALLLVGAPVTAGRVLVGALPTESLSLADGGRLGEIGVHTAIFVFDGAGRPIHHHPTGLTIDPTFVAALPPLPAEGVGTRQVRAGAQDLLVTYARVDPPGWTLVTAEDARAIASMGTSEVELLPLVLLFVALTALLAISFGVINVVRPLQELDRRAARVAWGDFDAVKQPVGGVQEVDELRLTLVQLAERVRSYQTGMRDYLAAITQAQEEERSRLAHELHDETVQALIALKQRAQMARKALGLPASGHAADPARAAARLEELEGLIDGELLSLRRLIGDLRPIYLEDLGFVPALEMLAQQTEARHGLRVALDIRGETIRLAPDLELAAYRTVQQALTNVVSHAQANNVVLGVTFAGDGLWLTVHDDGRGFTPPEQPVSLARQGHFGLMGMRERTILYGGRLSITSAPGQGCTVSVWLPVR
jgi:signal transduction histidine kinase